jgi:drug/metabolite transporter (DMT)-like permease
MFVMSASSSIGSMLLLRWRPQPELPLMSKALLKYGGWAAFGSTLGQTCYFIALMLAPNPAYVSMVALLAPVWLLIYHRVAGIKDDASPVAGTVLVLSAFLLMALSSL